MNRKVKLPRCWLPVAALIIAVPLFYNLLLPRLVNSAAATYIGQPLIWALVILLLRRLPSGRGLAKRRWRTPLLKIALGIAGFQIYLVVMAGFLYRFGKSPNSFTLSGVLINIVYVGTALIGMECSRAWLINRVQRRPGSLWPLLVALAYTLLFIPWNQVPPWGSGLEKFTSYLGSGFLPFFMENLMASFLAMWGGFAPALAYRGLVQGFNWFCPVLPDLNWALQALTGTVVPLVGLAVIQQYFELKRHPARAGEAGDVVNWSLICVGAVVAIWFSMGVFPIRPAVIYSGSMRPTFEVGDVVVIARQSPKLLTRGEIIAVRVKDDQVPTVHRIYKIRSDRGKLVFTTKGDDNRLPDSPPTIEDNVIGKVVAVIPKLGWGSIALRQVLFHRTATL